MRLKECVPLLLIDEVLLALVLDLADDGGLVQGPLTAGLEHALADRGQLHGRELGGYIFGTIEQVTKRNPG